MTGSLAIFNASLVPTPLMCGDLVIVEDDGGGTGEVLGGEGGEALGGEGGEVLGAE